MPTRIELGTDVAMVGVWDPGRSYPDIATKYREYMALLHAEAKAGRLFFINTGGDGGCPADIYVNEPPDAELLSFYETPEQAFLIESQSGRLIAGGLEDFGANKRQITTVEDEFTVKPGRYKLRCFFRDEERYEASLEKYIGRDDLDYTLSRFDCCNVGCFLFVVVLVLGVVSWVLAAMFPWLWMATAGVAMLGVGYITIRNLGVAKDERHQDILQRIAEYEARFPEMLFILVDLPPDEEIQGGWHDLY